MDKNKYLSKINKAKIDKKCSVLPRFHIGVGLFGMYRFHTTFKHSKRRR